MLLNQLGDNQGATKAKMRVGRGIACTKGKTCGRGVKGQKSRSGVSINGFEGGQNPIYRRLPKYGFKNYTALDLVTLTLARVQRAVDSGKLDSKSVVDSAALVKAGVVTKARDGIRLVAKGELQAKLQIVVHGCSASARAQIEKAGGSVTLPEVKAPAKFGKRQQRRKDAASKKAARLAAA